MTELSTGVDDPSNPFNDYARPNSWTPAINEVWHWGKDRVFGVNLGGWLVLAPFITPAIFQRYPSATDEFMLSQLMAADTVNGGLAQLEAHYKTFIVSALDKLSLAVSFHTHSAFRRNKILLRLLVFTFKVLAVFTTQNSRRCRA